jgi:SAM-dependent methyltransferase
VEEILRTIEENGECPALVTSLACGPAEEVFDVYRALDNPERLRCNLVDFDLQALAFVAERRDRARLQRQINLVNENLIYLALGRAKTPIRDQDLVYTVGLFDYFKDNLVIKLLNLVHNLLRPGGRVIVGNFHPRNRHKAFMDHVLEWQLIHRTEADMDRLFEHSAFGRRCTDVRFENQGINLFAECVKD